jgi:hypothetical protein
MSWRGCFRLDQKWVGAVGARVEVVLWCVVMFAASVQRDPTLHLRPGPPSGCAKLADCAQGSPGLCVYRTVRRAPLRRAFVAQSPYSIPPAMDISHGPQRARTRTQFRVVLRRQCIHIPHVTCARRGCPQHPSCVGVTPEPAISSRATAPWRREAPGGRRPPVDIRPWRDLPVVSPSAAHPPWPNSWLTAGRRGATAGDLSPGEASGNPSDGQTLRAGPSACPEGSRRRACTDLGAHGRALRIRMPWWSEGSGELRRVRGV